MGSPGRIAADAGIQVFAELARGTATAVYKGYDPARQAFVLLKVVLPAYRYDEGLLDRFAAEAHLAAQITHPNVVAVYDHGRTDMGAYLVTAFVEGGDLAAHLAAHGPMPWPLAVYALREAAQGLAAAHAAGVLHRDLKPSNLLLAPDGHVLLADFGMASVAEAAPAAAEVRGTPGYLAPEQIQGAPLTPAADLFALGATFFEMLTGRRAFVGATTAEVLDAVLHHDPLAYLDALPAAVRDVCGHLLARRPEDRPADATALVALLQACLPSGTDAEAFAAYLSDPGDYAAPAPVLTFTHTAASAPALAPTPSSPPWRKRLGIGAGVLAGLMLLLVVFQPDAPRPADDASARAQGSAAPTALADSGRRTMDSLAPAVTPAEVDRDTAAEERAEAPVRAASPDIQPKPAAPQTGRLRVAAQPWAAVQVDGVGRGTTPLAEALSLAPGRHTVRLTHPRFPAYEAAIEVVAGEEARLNVSLWDLVERLHLEVSPWAYVYLDADSLGATPLTQPLLLPAGAHRLTLSHPSLGRRDTTVRATPGAERTLRFNLLR